MTYEMHVAGLTRQLPLCPISDKLMIGAFVIFGDVELTCACAAGLLKIAPEFDYMVAPEAKAIPLVHEMARQSGRNEYFLVRKAPKLYMDGVFEAVDRSITTAGEQKLYMDGADASPDRVASTARAAQAFPSSAASIRMIWFSLRPGYLPDITR